MPNNIRFTDFATWVLKQPDDAIAISVDDVDNWWGAQFYRCMNIVNDKLSFHEYEKHYAHYYSGNIYPNISMVNDYQTFFREDGPNFLWTSAIEIDMRISYRLSDTRRSIPFLSLKKVVIDHMKVEYNKDYTSLVF